MFPTEEYLLWNSIISKFNQLFNANGSICKNVLLSQSRISPYHPKASENSDYLYVHGSFEEPHVVSSMCFTVGLALAFIVLGGSLPKQIPEQHT